MFLLINKTNICKKSDRDTKRYSIRTYQIDTSLLQPLYYRQATPRYQCYSVACWQGTPGLASLPSRQCAFRSASTSSTLAQKMQEQGFPSIFVNLVASQSTARPFHLLPPEYPLLTLVPFSLA